MKILVTGGNGFIGRATVKRLLRLGHQVRSIDLQDQSAVPGCEYARCDLTDYAALRQQVKDQEGIIHLAALIHPGAGPAPEIFRINCTGSFNVFQAAAEEGIRKVSCASSINALGYNFGVKHFDIQYFPIDEEHPTLTTDAYSFSKQVTEAISAYFWRRDGISSVCLRLPIVYAAEDEMWKMATALLARKKGVIGDLLTLPEKELAERMGLVRQAFLAIRQKRIWEKPWGEHDAPPFDENDPATVLLFGATDFWTVIHVEDAALVMIKGLSADYTGSHALFANETSNYLGIESETLARLFYPETKGRKHDLQGTESLVSCDRAARLLGFQAEHSAHDWFESLANANP